MLEVTQEAAPMTWYRVSRGSTIYGWIRSLPFGNGWQGFTAGRNQRFTAEYSTSGAAARALEIMALDFGW